MRFILIAITFIATLCLLDCTQSPSPGPSPIGGVVCNVEQDIAGAFASTIAKSLSCSNQATIQSDVLGFIGKANLCASSVNHLKSAPKSADGKMKGVIGNIACPIAVNAVMGAAGAAVPASWGCAPNSGANSLNAALTATCEQLVTY